MSSDSATRSASRARRYVPDASRFVNSTDAPAASATSLHASGLPAVVLAQRFEVDGAWQRAACETTVVGVPVPVFTQTV